MNDIQHVVSAICEQVRGDSTVALKAVRVSRRHARLIEPAVLTPEQAELGDLNRIVWDVVAEALPLCRAIGTRLVLQQDPRLPAVPMLVRPVEDTIASSLDLCLEEEPKMLRVRTWAERGRAVMTLESVADATEPSMPDTWREVGAMGTVELIVGERALRALGGRLHVYRKNASFRVWLEIPTGEEHHQQPFMDRGAGKPIYSLESGFTFPGSGGAPSLA